MVQNIMEEGQQDSDKQEPSVCWHAPDHSFKKYIIQPGVGFHSPLEWSTCRMSLTHLTDASTLDIGYPAGEDVEVQVETGSGEDSDLIDKCVKSMKEGEICEMHIEKQSSENKKIEIHVMKLHLMSVEGNIEIWQLTPGQKMGRAKYLKTHGINLFIENKIELAFKKFVQSIKYLILMYPECSVPENIVADHRLLKCQCYLNIAACQMKYKSWDFVITNCDKALLIDPCNVKGLYRRAMALCEQEEFARSLDDIDKGLGVEPNNKALQALRKNIKDKQKHSSQCLADGLSKMFTN